VKKACPANLIHQSQFQLRNSHSWFYNKDPTFSWFKEVLVVSQVIKKEGCPSNGMKTGTYQPNQGACAYCQCKSSHFLKYDKSNYKYICNETAQNSVQSWWGTLLDLGNVNRRPFPVPCCLEQITYWITADIRSDRTLMNQEDNCLAHLLGQGSWYSTLPLHNATKTLHMNCTRLDSRHPLQWQYINQQA
jgi:hypothetical protein